MSEESCDFMIKQQGIQPDKVQAIDFGVDTDIFGSDNSPKNETRGRYGIPNDAIVVMQTGKLSPEKGTHILSEAMLQLMLSDPNLWLVLVGGGKPEYLEQCLTPFTNSNLIDRVH